MLATACGSNTDMVSGSGGGSTRFGSGGATSAVATAIATAGTAGKPSTSVEGSLAGGTAGSAGLGNSGPGGTSNCGFGAPVAVGKAQPPVLSNLSGLVASRSQPGVLFAHPDRSGAIFFAIQQSGVSLGQFTLVGATATDCEDIAIGPGPEATNTVYLGDIGDNSARPGTGLGRSEIQVFRFAEPSVTSASSSTMTSLTNWQLLRFRYPDRTHDAETLMVDPGSGDLFVVTREADGSAFVFTAPGSTPVDSLTVLTRVAVIQVGASGANAGDMSPAGDLALIRTYEAAWIFRRGPEASWQQAFAASAVSLPVAAEAQSEGATFGSDGRSWLSAGEVDPTIFKADTTCP